MTPGSRRPGSGDPPVSGGASLADAALTDAAPAAAAPIQPPATSASPTGTGWLRAIGGLLAGLLVGGALVRAAMGRRTAPAPEPATPPDPARMQPID